MPSKIYKETAEKYLALPRLREALAGREVPSSMSGITLNNESEVVSASFAYVIIPIIEALEVLFENRWEINSEEHAHRNKQLDDEQNKSKKKGDTRTGELRMDLAFRKKSTAENKGDIVAILEYKRRHLIQYTDFDAAILPANTDKAKIVDSLLDIRRSNAKTRLIGNAVPYSQQLAAYSKRIQCKHLALFNWDHLVMFDFPVLEGPSRNLDDPAEIPKIAWLQEVSKQDAYMEKGPIRRVLLGWVLKAFEDAGFVVEEFTPGSKGRKTDKV